MQPANDKPHDLRESSGKLSVPKLGRLKCFWLLNYGLHGTARSGRHGIPNESRISDVFFIPTSQYRHRNLQARVLKARENSQCRSSPRGGQEKDFDDAAARYRMVSAEQAGLDGAATIQFIPFPWCFLRMLPLTMFALLLLSSRVAGSSFGRFETWTHPQNLGRLGMRGVSPGPLL